MFETAELGHKIDKETYLQEAPQVRAALLEAQQELAEANCSVIVIVTGVTGAGKSETVNLLLEWMDARGIHTHAMREPTDEELADVVFALRELDPDSVPVNFLIPFEGTPLGGEWSLTPQRCLRILAMVRFACPDAEVRLAGGREIHLRSLQPLALHIVNSIFLGDYLTSEGQAGARDLEMIADAGFTVEGADDRTLPEHRRDLVKVRRRGLA